MYNYLQFVLLPSMLIGNRVYKIVVASQSDNNNKHKKTSEKEFCKHNFHISKGKFKTADVKVL